MRKIPTMFQRTFENGKVAGISPVFTNNACEYALKKGIATIKMDGSCCAIIDGEFYKRFDAKPGRKIPEGAIACCEADPITGHHPHWVKVDFNNPDNKWLVKAWKNTPEILRQDRRTYEAVGTHFQGNPYDMAWDLLVMHGVHRIALHNRTFSGVYDFLKENPVEGLVFWVAGMPVCKIKRTDFGLPWPAKEEIREIIRKEELLLSGVISQSDAARILGLEE